MQGKIVKGIAGFYYVYEEESGELFECKAKGIFRKERLKPLVGDNVRLTAVAGAGRCGNIMEILPRQNELIRPAVANIDQAMILFAVVKPEPNYNLLDRFLVTMERQQMPCVICFNKKDLATEAEQEELRRGYETCGFAVLFVSATEQDGMDELLTHLRHKTTVVDGPSGVGKSTLINYLCPQAEMATGEISPKIERGRHTTRHSEIFALEAGTYICDTPGFTSLSLNGMEKEELKRYYPEFERFERRCRFRECAHIGEPVCGVKEALVQGGLSPIRYDNYLKLYEELKQSKRY